MLAVMLIPYWQNADGAIVVYNARFEDVLAAGLVPVRDIDLIHDDPPYGVKERTNRGAAGRGKNVTAKTALHGGRFIARQIAQAADFPSVEGDDRPFDARDLIALDRPTVIWGGHLCEPALPRSSSLVVWDKRDGVLPDDNGDAEIAWTNLGGPIRVWSHLWKGTCRASETGVQHLHPTQKPVELSRWIFRERAKLKPGALVLVPHGGSGPDLPAARALGLRVIWCETVRGYCDTAIARLPEAPPSIVARAVAFQRSIRARAAEPAEALGPLFAGGAR